MAGNSGGDSIRCRREAGVLRITNYGPGPSTAIMLGKMYSFAAVSALMAIDWEASQP